MLLLLVVVALLLVVVVLVGIGLTRGLLAVGLRLKAP
jgi:hypothetical protein